MAEGRGINRVAYRIDNIELRKKIIALESDLLKEYREGGKMSHGKILMKLIEIVREHLGTPKGKNTPKSWVKDCRFYAAVMWEHILATPRDIDAVIEVNTDGEA